MRKMVLIDSLQQGQALRKTTTRMPSVLTLNPEVEAEAGAEKDHLLFIRRL